MIVSPRCDQNWQRPWYTSSPFAYSSSQGHNELSRQLQSAHSRLDLIGITVAVSNGNTQWEAKPEIRPRSPIMPIPLDNHDRAIDYLTIPLRLALALSFLFPVADRLGLLGPPGTPGVDWGNFTNFLSYNAQVNSFLPAVTRPALGVTATVLETLLGVSLLLGLYTRLAAACSGALLLLFGCAMAISFGIKSPFDYSVFSAMGGALLLAGWRDYPLSADALFPAANS